MAVWKKLSGEPAAQSEVAVWCPEDGREGVARLRFAIGGAQIFGHVYRYEREYDSVGAIVSEREEILDRSPEFVS